MTNSTSIQDSVEKRNSGIQYENRTLKKEPDSLVHSHLSQLHICPKFVSRRQSLNETTALFGDAAFLPWRTTLQNHNQS